MKKILILSALVLWAAISLFYSCKKETVEVPAGVETTRVGEKKTLVAFSTTYISDKSVLSKIESITNQEEKYALIEKFIAEGYSTTIAYTEDQINQIDEYLNEKGESGWDTFQSDLGFVADRSCTYYSCGSWQHVSWGTCSSYCASCCYVGLTKKNKYVRNKTEKRWCTGYPYGCGGYWHTRTYTVEKCGSCPG